MCDDAKTPHLRTYTVQFNPRDGMWPEDAKAKAQGVRWNVDSHLVELWRRIEGGEEQLVGAFRAEQVRGIYEDTADAEMTVPEDWMPPVTTINGGGLNPSTPPPPSDDDVPF